MNNFDDVYALNRDERQISNLETYRRFISKGDKPLECINDEDAKAKFYITGIKLKNDDADDGEQTLPPSLAAQDAVCHHHI